MSKKTFVVVLIVLILVALAGVGIIVVPPLLQDAQLTKESEEYSDLTESLRVRVTPSETETAAPVNTGFVPDTEPPVTDPPTTTEPPEESHTPEETPPPETEEPESEEDSKESEWNPFGNSGKKGNSALGLLDNNEEKEEEEKLGNGLRFGKYSNDTDNIAPVDNPDAYNQWLIDKLKTPTPTPKPTPTPTVSPTPKPTPTPTPTPRIGGYTQINLTECKAKNSEFIAWLKIPGTNIDYPVVHSNNTDYYLTHTFEGKQSDLGTLFSLGKANWKAPSKNIVIYGHHVEGSGDKMFKALLKYKNASYYKDHSVVYLDSMYADGYYQIFAVFNETEGDIDPSCSSFASNSEFLDFVYAAKDLSFYDTGVVLNEEDHIVTFVTCDRYFKRGVGRLVVMAVRK